MSPDRYLPETMGPGMAFFDYDNDGWMDVYGQQRPADFYTPKTPLKHALYKNNRDGTFTDVTEKAGVTGQTFGMGCAIGDYDNDGYPDIFITAYGRPILYRNNGNGTFTDVTEKSGLHKAPTGRPARSGSTTTTMAGWICSCAASSSSRWRPPVLRRQQGRPAVLLHSARLPAHAEPALPQQRRRHLHRRQPGTDIARAMGKALGVVATDINNDGLMDLFVANDTVQNFLFPNRGKASGRRSAWRRRWLQRQRHAAVRHGRGRGRLRSGRLARPVRRERRSGDVLPLPQRWQGVLYGLLHHGIAQATQLLSGWGLKFFDYDNDGDLDLFLANGHPDDMVEQYQPAGQIQGATAAVSNRQGSCET